MNTDKIKPCIIPSLLFLSSFILRFALISKGPFHVDCLNLVLKAEETLVTGRIHPLPGFGYPLTVLLGAVFIKAARLFGNTDAVFAVNLMSVVFGSLGVAVLYLFTERLTSQKAALFSAILFSFYPFFFGVSLYGMSHTPAVFFLLTGLLLISIYKNTDRLSHLLLSGLCFGLMAAARLQDLILMLIPVTFYYFLGDSGFPQGHNTLKTLKTRFHKYLLFVLVIFILALLSHSLLIFDPAYQQKSAISWFWKAGLTSNFMGFFSSHLQASLFMITFSLSPGGIISALLGLTLLARKKTGTSIFLFMWFIVPLMFYGNLYTTTSRFLIISAIALIIAEGYTLDYLTAQPRWFLKAGAILSFGLILWVTFKEVYPIFKFRHMNAPLVEFSRWVSSVTEPDAVIIAADDGIFIRHYGRREAVHNPCGIYQVNKTALPGFKEWLDQRLALGHPVYITYGGLRAGDMTNEFLNFIFDNYTLYWVGQHLSEDWHSSSTRLLIGQEQLYKIIPKAI